MAFAPRAIATFFSQLVNVCRNWLTSKLKIPPITKPVNRAETKPTNGRPPPSSDETLIRVPLYRVKFGGEVEGQTYIPVKAPLKVRRDVSSPFGRRNDPLTGEVKDHNGIDLESPVGDEVYPPENGEVLTAEFKGDGAGRRVVVLHRGRGYKFCTAYFHLSRILVKVGDKVTRETCLGLTGGAKDDPESGKTTGPHLHYETRTWPEYVAKKPILEWLDA